MSKPIIKLYLDYY